MHEYSRPSWYNGQPTVMTCNWIGSPFRLFARPLGGSVRLVYREWIFRT